MAEIFTLKSYAPSIKRDLERRNLDKFLDSDDIQGTFTLSEIEALLIVKDLEFLRYEWLTALASLSIVEAFMSNNEDYYRVLPRYGISAADADYFIHDFEVKEKKLLLLGEIDTEKGSVEIKHCKGMSALLVAATYLYKELIVEEAKVPSVESDFGLNRYGSVYYEKLYNSFVLFTQRARQRLLAIGSRKRTSIF